MLGEKNRSLKQQIGIILEKNVGPAVYGWLVDKAMQSSDKDGVYQLNLTFTAIPRKTGREEVKVEEAEIRNLDILLPGFMIQNWPLDRLARVWLLMEQEIRDQQDYLTRIENLFPHAEMNELVALYSSLPVLAYPEAWRWRCTEGVRSNIGTVLEAIMYFNPYPANYLDEGAWNQLVMKAFFTDKNVNNIVGLDKRANKNLAGTLFDYVEERWAAGRTVNPEIWRLTGKYMDDPHFYMVEKLFKQGNETEMQAGALMCADSSFQKCKFLLDRYPQLKKEIERHELNWGLIAKRVTKQ